MAKKKVKRKELIKGPDEFISTTNKVILWAQENTRQLIYGGVALLVLVVLVSGYSFIKQKREQAAAALLSQCMETYQSAQEGKEDPAKMLAMAKPDFERLIKEYGGKSAGRLGRVIYGHLALAAKEMDLAKSLYETALADFKDDPDMKNTILNGLAMVAVQTEDNAAAIGYFEKIASGKSLLLKDVALFNLGQLYTESGETDKGKEAYKRLSNEYPDSMYANIAREKAAV